MVKEEVERKSFNDRLIALANIWSSQPLLVPKDNVANEEFEQKSSSDGLVMLVNIRVSCRPISAQE